MSILLTTAAAVAILTGIVHSLLGERLIFRRLRASTLVPGLPAPPLQGRHVRILWATWHLGSVFGWAFAGLLLQLAHAPAAALSAQSVLAAVAAAHLGAALLVFVATRGRHPGWIALALVALLSWTAIGAS